MAKDFCTEYDFRIGDVISWIKKNGFRRVLLQLPEGFMRCFDLISERITEVLDVEIVVSANPSFGPCLVDEISARLLNADAIVHFGHLEYPRYRPTIPTLFVPTEWKYMERNWLEEELSRIAGSGKKVVVVTVAQHVSAVREVCKRLGLEFRGVMLGCYIPIDKSFEGTLAVVAGGDFHCVSAYLYSATANMDVVCIDPYSMTSKSGADVGEKVLRTRVWKVVECLNAKKWLIVDGLLGQNRELIVAEIVRLVKERKGVAHRVNALRIDENYLRNLGAENFDCIVITACPRIAVDDLKKFERPVLTPGEAIMVLRGSIERYVYPW